MSVQSEFSFHVLYIVPHDDKCSWPVEQVYHITIEMSPIFIWGTVHHGASANVFQWPDRKQHRYLQNSVLSDTSLIQLFS